MKTLKIVVFLYCLIGLSSLVNALNKPNNFYTDEKIPAFGKDTSALLLPLNTNDLVSDKETVVIMRELDKGFAKIKLALTKRELPPAQFYPYLEFTDMNRVTDSNAVAEKYAFIQSLETDHDLIIVPSVFETLGDFNGETMKWDGVIAGVGTKTLDRGGWAGKALAYSMRMEVYSNSGEWLMTVFGGLAMPKELDSSTDSFIRKDFLFESSASMKTLDRGVRVIMQPFKKKLKIK